MRLLTSGMRPALLGVAVRTVIFVTCGAAAQAQGIDVREQARRATASRVDLESIASSIEQSAAQPGLPVAVARARLADATQLRERLRSGDFQVGDRIALRLVEPAYQDTLTVRAGQTILIPQVGEISLAGALRSELEPHVRRELGKFLRTVQVTATAVTRLGVFGPVGRQGFYQFQSDMMLSQAIMQAGGPLPTADMGNITIVRADKPTWERASVLVAIQEGVTLEQLGVRGGDEIRIEEKRDLSFQTVLSFVSISLQLVSLVFIISRR